MNHLVYGETLVSEDKYLFCYDYDLEKITLYSDSMILLPDVTTYILGLTYNQNRVSSVLYKMSVPSSDNSGACQNAGVNIGLRSNKSFPIDFFVENYAKDSMYSEMRLHFSELNYMFPSENMIYKGDDNKIQVRDNKMTVYSFEIKYAGIPIKVSFNLSYSCDYKKGCQVKLETLSEVSLSFEETNDLEFIVNLYYRVRDFFCFVCNRQNIGLRSATIFGKFPCKTCKFGKIVDSYKNTQQTIFFSQKFLDPPEIDERNIKRVVRLSSLSDRISTLFQLFLGIDHLDNQKVDASSVHSSTRFRDFINLDQSLRIISTFEYYLNSFLPKISSDNKTLEFYNDMDKYLNHYIEENRGKKKREARNLRNFLSPYIPLEGKINKVYDGYSNWKPLKGILSEWFGDDVSSLARAASSWRNDLAHGNRTYMPTDDSINAIRLVEHLNYCIVFRISGYSDSRIKMLVSTILDKGVCPTTQ